MRRPGLVALLGWMLLLGDSFAGPAGEAAAEELDPNGGRKRTLERSAPESGPLPPGTISPHNLDGKNLSEAWNYIIEFPNGYFINTQFSITNVGPIHGTGLVVAYIHSPDGEVVRVKNSRGKGEWEDSSTPDGPVLSIARHRLEIAGDRQRVQLGFDRGTLELDLERLTPPLQSGRLRYTKDRWFDLTVFAPRASVEGRYVLDGETIELEDGRAVGVHLLSNLPEHKQATATFGVHAFSPEIGFSLFELTAPSRYSFEKAGLLMVFEEDRLIGYYPTFNRGFPNKRSDPERTEYPIPETLRLGSPDGEIEATADLELVKRDEILALLNSKILRGILGLITKPALYQFRTDYELRLEKEGGVREASGRGVATLYISSKPPASY